MNPSILSWSHYPTDHSNYFMHCSTAFSWPFFLTLIPVPSPTSPICDNSPALFPTTERLSGGGGRKSQSRASSTSDDVMYITDTEDNTTSFIHEQWIGSGKSWHDEVPWSVKNARDEARSIPLPAIKSIALPSNLPVSTILSHAHALPQPLKSLSDPQYELQLPNFLIDLLSPNFLTQLRDTVLPILLGLASHPKDAHLSSL